jgi:hypothetical protein
MAGYSRPEDNNFMGSGLSYEQYSYQQALKESQRPGSMSYGEIPRAPGQDWNQWRAQQEAFNKTYTGQGIPTARGAAEQRDRGVQPSKPATRPRTGGGGGGGYMMPQQQQAQAPTPVEFYQGLAPTLQALTMDYGELGKRVMEVNKPFAEQFRQFNPMAEAGTRALSQAGATSATGQIGRDEMGELARTNAFLGFGTGLGGRSGAGRARIARDVGLSVAQARQQGANLLAQATGLTQQAMAAMMPVSATEIFTTAANQASINNQIANQNLLNTWQSQALPGQFDVQKGQFVSFTPGQYSATRPLLPGTTFIEKPKSEGMFSGGNWLEREDARNKQIDRQNEAIRAQASNWVGSAYRPQYS